MADFRFPLRSGRPGMSCMLAVLLACGDAKEPDPAASEKLAGEVSAAAVRSQDPGEVVSDVKELAPLPPDLEGPVDAAARALFVERLRGQTGGAAALIESLESGETELKLEAVQSPVIAGLPKGYAVVRATLTRRSPERCLLVVDPEGEVWDPAREIDELLVRLKEPENTADALALARLYVSLSTLSSRVVFIEDWTDVPVPASPLPKLVSAEKYAADIRPAAVELDEAGWSVDLVAWESVLGRLRRWEIRGTKEKKSIAASTKEIAQRLGDYTTSDY